MLKVTAVAKPAGRQLDYPGTRTETTRPMASPASSNELQIQWARVRGRLRSEFGEAAYPFRVLMAEFPAGATIIPNPVNRVASFSVRSHHFFPGFPQMAWPMLEWVLATRYSDLAPPPAGERAIIVHGAGESQLLPLMNECVARYPQLKLFSLPTFMPEGGRRLELGVRGEISALDAALADLIAGVEAGGFRWEPFGAERADMTRGGKAT